MSSVARFVKWKSHQVVNKVSPAGLNKLQADAVEVRPVTSMRMRMSIGVSEAAVSSEGRHLAIRGSAQSALSRPADSFGLRQLKNFFPITFTCLPYSNHHQNVQISSHCHVLHRLELHTEPSALEFICTLCHDVTHLKPSYHSPIPCSHGNTSMNA